MAQLGAIILRRRLLYRYVLLDLRHSPPYDESFVGYGKDRVSYTYELAARRVAFEVQPEIFAIHYTTVTRGAKKAYGHSPVDWMVGETCWPAFRSRVKQAYRFDTTSCAQDATDRQVRRRYGCAAAGGEARCCVSEAEGLCVGRCRPEALTYSGTGGAPLARTPPTHAEWPRNLTRAAAAHRAPTAPSPAGGSGDGGGAAPTVFVIGCDGCGSGALA